MTPVFIGLGSNLQNPLEQIKSAMKELHNLPDSIYKKNSSFYSSLPVGPQDQPEYINAVAEIDVGLDALDLLDCLQDIENKHGRQRKIIRWGPRTLDLDILLYGEDVIENDRLIIPHKEMHNRNFVLAPLYEIAPDLVIPERGRIFDLVKSIDLQGVRKLDI